MKHLFLACRLELLLVEEISGAAVLGAETDDVLIPEARNRSGDEGRAAGSDAEVARNRVGQPCVGSLSHQLQCAANALVGDDAQKR